MPACHLHTFVADIAFSRVANRPQLVEINPYGGSAPRLHGDYAVEAWGGGIITERAGKE